MLQFPEISHALCSSAGHLSQKLKTKKLEPSGKLRKKPFEDEEQDFFIMQASTKSKNMTETTREPPSKIGKVIFGKNGEPLI